MALIRREDVKRFLCIQGALYLLFLTGDCFSLPGTLWLKYGSILLCGQFAVHSAARGGEPLVAWAMGFTLGADLFLLVLDRWYGVGIALFCVVQALYLRRLRASGRPPRWPVRAAILAGALLLLRAVSLLNGLTGLAAVYFTTFLCSTLESLRIHTSRFRVFSLGMILFLCCDICVAAANCPQLFPAVFSAFAQMGMWLFYLPGQVLIALSALPESAFVRS